MPCYRPIPAFRTPDGVVFSERHGSDIVGRIDIPCGQCIGCRLRRAQDWSVRIGHEAQLWRENCFVTLTYGRDKLPPGGSLCYADYQGFMRRMRREFKRPIRFFMCGEYGPVNLRPHFHACLFNIDFRDGSVRGKSSSGSVFKDSPTLERLWGHGMVSVQPLNSSTAAYCARYIVDKVTGDGAELYYSSVDADGVINSRIPEFCRCSLRPGIGADWYRKYAGDLFRHDVAVVDGKEFTVPKYYDKLRRRSKVDVFDDDSLEFAREVRARKGAADQTPERLAVREVVHKARVRNQKREL